MSYSDSALAQPGQPQYHLRRPPCSDPTYRLYPKTLCQVFPVCPASSHGNHDSVGTQEIVADFCGRFFTGDGHEAGGKFVVAIEPDQLRKAREVVAVAGGVSKARAIRAILRGKLITTLVTDEDTARAVLGLEDGRGAGT